MIYINTFAPTNFNKKNRLTEWHTLSHTLTHTRAHIHCCISPLNLTSSKQCSFIVWFNNDHEWDEYSIFKPTFFKRSIFSSLLNTCKQRKCSKFCTHFFCSFVFFFFITRLIIVDTKLTNLCVHDNGDRRVPLIILIFIGVLNKLPWNGVFTCTCYVMFTYIFIQSRIIPTSFISALHIYL